MVAPARAGATDETAADVTLWPQTRSTAAALVGLIGVQVALFYFVARPAFFATDDFLHFRLAEERGFIYYLASPILGVYPAPGHRLATWLLHTLFPLNHTAALVFVLAFLAATTFALAYLVRLLARSDDWWTVALLAPFAFSVTLVSPVWWWSNGLPVMPALLFTAVALAAWLQSYTDERRTLWIVVMALAIAGAGAFHIKFLLIPVYFLFIRLVILPSMLGLANGLRALWSERWRWVAVGIAPALFVAVLVLGGLLDRSAVPGERPYLSYLAAAWFHVLAPVSFLNTPLEPDSPAALLWPVAIIGQLLLVGVVVATWWRTVLAPRAWALFVLAFLVNALMVGSARLPGFGIEIAYWLRYYPEVVFFLPLVLALGLRQGAERRPSVAWERAIPGRAALALLACVHLVGFLVWAPGLVRDSDGALARAWFENLALDLERRDEPLRLVDSETPEYVMPPWMANNRVSTVLALLDVEGTYDDWSEDTLVVLDDGRLAPASFTPVEDLVAEGAAASDVALEHAEPGDEGLCLASVGRLQHDPEGGVRGERLAVVVIYAGLSDGGLAVEVATDDVDRPVRRFDLHPAERSEEVIDLGVQHMHRITVEGTDEAEVCVERITIGSLPAG